jgi:hypothetical protein
MLLVERRPFVIGFIRRREWHFGGKRIVRNFWNERAIGGEREWWVGCCGKCGERWHRGVERYIGSERCFWGCWHIGLVGVCRFGGLEWFEWFRRRCGGVRNGWIVGNERYIRHCGGGRLCREPRAYARGRKHHGCDHR